MTRTLTYCISVFVKIQIVLVVVGQMFAQSVSFDCPAVTGADLTQLSSSSKLVEVTLPISVSNHDAKWALQDLRVDVHWNRNAYPVVDYAPRTQMRSDFDGPIEVENRTETRVAVGAKTSSSYFEFVSPTLNADVGRNRSESRRYNQIPEQSLFIASGTAKRGTGVFFNFKPSPVDSMEGDRQLKMTFDVPVTWRGGILQVTIRALGRRKKLAAFYDDFDQARVFMVGVYEKGDEQARRFAGQFARLEQQLRYDWERYTDRQQSTTQQFERFLAGQTNEVSPLWVHQLIQSDSDRVVRLVEKRIPKSIAQTASEFVDARRNLVALGR